MGRGIGFPDVSLIEPLAASLGITIAELFKGERTVNSVDNEYESLLSDVVKVSATEITRKKKQRIGLFLLLLLFFI